MEILWNHVMSSCIWVYCYILMVNFLTQKRISEQGRKAVYSLFNKIQDGCYNIETLLSLFDTYVTSIWNYGCDA